MKTKLLLLLLAALACAGAQEPVLVQKSATNGNTISTMTFSSGGGFGASMGEAQRMFEEVQKAAQAAMQDAMSAAGTARNFAGGGTFATPGASRKPAAPALLTTRPMDAATRAEWQEDLRVMDKLLRDQVTAAEGDSTRQAMGIRLWLTEKVQTAPTLLEDCGIIFSYEVGFPLAASPNPRPAAGREGNPASAWEQARSELQTTRTNTTAALPSAPATTTAAHEPAKVEALIDALAGILPEARNIRHLGPNSSITVTVAGLDSAGAPVRLTLKSTKASLEKATSGAPTLERLRQALAWTIQ